MQRWVTPRGYYWVDANFEGDTDDGHLRFLDAELAAPRRFDFVVYQGTENSAVDVSEHRIVVTTTALQTTLYDVEGAVVSGPISGYGMARLGGTVVFPSQGDLIFRWEPPGAPTEIGTLFELGARHCSTPSLIAVLDGQFLASCVLPPAILYLLSPTGGPARTLVDMTALGEAYLPLISNEQILLLERGFDQAADAHALHVATGQTIDLVPAISALPLASDCPSGAHEPIGHGFIFRDRYVYPGSGGLFSVRILADRVDSLERLTDDPVVAPIVTPDGVLFAREDERLVRYATYRYLDRVP